MKETKKRGIKSFGILGVFALCISLALAFGVGSTYTKDNPVKLYPGQIVEISVELQNMVPEDGDLTFNANIDHDGQGTVSFLYEDATYFVPNGQRVKVPLRISIPDDAVVGDRYSVWISFLEAPGENTGMIGFVGKINSQFDIAIVHEEENSFYSPGSAPESSPVSKPGNNNALYIVLLIAIILVVAYFLYNKK